MRIDRLCALALPLLCFPTTMQAQQQGISMTLDELFRSADEHSRSLRIHAFKVEEADKALRTARQERLPQIDASLSFSYLGNGRVWDRDFSNGMKAPIPHYGNNFALAASQVVYSGGAVSSRIEMAKIAGEMAGEEERQSRGDVRFLITGYYLELYKLDNQIRVYDRNIALTDELIASTRARYEQGTVLENDLTRYELQKENYKLARTRMENDRHVLNYRLNKLAGLDEQTYIMPDTALLALLPTAEPSAAWQREAAASAPRLSLSELNIRLSTRQEKLFRSEQLPKVALVAEEHLDGPVTIEVPVLNNNFNYWFVGVGIRYSLSSLYKSRSKIRQARLETMRHTEELSRARDEVACAIEDDYTRYGEAVHEAEVLRTNVKLAGQNYATTHTRYVNGLALATDMLEVSNALLDAELQWANARANIQYTYYKLRHTSGTL